MIMLVCGCIIFFGIHSVQIAFPGLRTRMVARLGKSKWMLLYSALAGIGLALIIIGYGGARQWNGGRRRAVWQLLRMGASRPAFFFVPAGKADPPPAGQAVERCHRHRWRLGDLRAVCRRWPPVAHRYRAHVVDH